MQLLRAATLTTPDPAATAARYGQWLDYALVEQGQVDAALAASWGAPASAGKAYAVCRPASGADVFLRFVEGTPEPDYRPLRTYGWAAIEICVQDTLDVHARMLQSPFEVIGPPRELDSMPEIFPMQVRGPDGEIVYLTEIRGDTPPFRLPRAGSLVDKLFILVLACSDMEATRLWFDRILSIRTGFQADIIYTMLAKAFDLPVEQKHRIATGVHDLDCFLEFDQYPAEATPRPGPADALKPGIALATLIHPDFVSIQGDWITPPAVREGAIYGGARTGTLRAPDGSLVEVVERA